MAHQTFYLTFACRFFFFFCWQTLQWYSTLICQVCGNLDILFVSPCVYQFKNVYNFILKAVIWNWTRNTLNLKIILLNVLVKISFCHLYYQLFLKFIDLILQILIFSLKASIIEFLMLIMLSLTTTVMFNWKLF